MGYIALNTRFNPTLCGNLHIGHIANILVNEYVAHSSGGKFIIRFDDNQEWWKFKLPKRETEEYRKHIMDDVYWMGINVDKWTSQYELREESKQLIYEFNGGPLQVRDLRNNVMRGPKILYSTSTPYPYAPEMTAEAVVLDYMDAITCLIRGEDITFQGSLYWWFCDLWRLPMPQQIYIDRITSLRDGELTEVSKSKGGYELSYFRQKGYTPENIREMLGEICKKDTDGPWSLENLKMKFVLES